MPELRAETRLRAGGMSGAPQASSVLAARVPLLHTAPSQPPASTERTEYRLCYPVPLLWQPLLLSRQPRWSVSSTDSVVWCHYYGKDNHTEDVCRKKQRDKKARRGQCSSSSTARSVSALEQEVLTLFRRLNAVTPSGITAQTSGPSPPPPPSGISYKWFLDSGASFHMTPDSS